MAHCRNISEGSSVNITQSADTAKKAWLAPRIRRMGTPRAEGAAYRAYSDSYYGS